MKMKRVIPFLIILILGFTGCQRPGPDQSEATPEEEKVTTFAVNVTPAVRGEIKNYLELNGDVQARTNVDVYPDTAGKVSRIFVNLGDQVSKDQILAEVDPSRPGTNFSASPVRAPISGTVVSQPSPVGSTVAPSMPLIKLSKMTEMEVKTEVSERFVSKMQRGLPTLLTFEAYPGEVFEGRVTKLEPVVDPASRTLGITISFNDPDPRIKVGMFAQVKVITEEKEGIVKIPAQCLVRRFGKYYVFVDKQDGTVERREVTPGIEIDDKLEILDGLSQGEMVVYRGQTLLEEGASIRVIETIEPLTEADEVR